MEVTYQYYKESFYGDKIAESDFPKWLKRSGEKLNRLIFGKAEQAAEAYPDKTRDALCALADCMYLVDQERSRALEPAAESNIKSMSSGGESITFDAPKSIYQTVLASTVEENRLYRGVIAEYLHGTGLLYAGGR